MNAAEAAEFYRDYIELNNFFIYSQNKNARA